MNLLDIVIISGMIFLIMKGLLHGFIRELASLAGVVLGVVLGNHFQPQMTAYLKSYLPHTTYLPLISFGVLFASILIFCNLLGYLFKALFEKSFLGWLDKTLGVWLAMTKGVIVIYLVIVLFTFFLPARTPLIANSRLAPWIIVSYQSMIRLISPEHYEKWKKKILGDGKEGGEIVSENLNDMTKKNE
ncbi:MAG: CvpA family protein [Desulfobacteraceae bacterium]|jgi:membrane protein required for colicin V production